MERRLSCMVYLYIFLDQHDWVKRIGWEVPSALGICKGPQVWALEYRVDIHSC